MNLYDPNGRPVGLGEDVGRGGEATVHLVVNRPDQLAKIYQPAPRPNYPTKLSWMVANPPSNPTRAISHASLAWPACLLNDQQGRMVGYLMPYIQVATPILDVFNPRRRQEILPSFDRRYLHRVARNLAAAIGAVHTGGYIIGDLNESNILVTPAALVTIIDTDSFQVQERSQEKVVVHYCPVGKLEYTPPELQGRSVERVLRHPEHDAFGLGVLIFQLLMDGNHPFRAQWLAKGEPPPLQDRIAKGYFPYTATPLGPVAPPRSGLDINWLHPTLVELFRRCFVDGYRNPARRPNPARWEKALAEAERALVVCKTGHIFSGHLPACPVCGEPQVDVTPVVRAIPTRPRQAAIPYVEPKPSSPNIATAGPASVTLASPWSWSLPRLQMPAWVKRLSRSMVMRSLLTGGVLGASVGALPGGLVSFSGMAIGHTTDWSVLWLLGGIAGGLSRGWGPGYRLGQWIERRIGWHRFWQAAGLIGGTVIGGVFGLVTGAVLIFPIILGMIGGARAGFEAGRRLWQIGDKYGWGRIWGAFGAANSAIIGAGVAWMAGIGLPGTISDRLALNLADWLAGQSVSLPLVWVATGAFAGALGGWAAGFMVDFMARFFRLVD